MSSLADWCREHRITEVECMIPDLSGIPRGKILPTDKFLAGVEKQNHRIPESLFVHAVTGDDPDIPDIVSIMDRDVHLIPDAETIRTVPWYKEPTAQVICDCAYPDGRPVDIYSRSILRHVLGLYEARGWRPQVSPELEFYLVSVNRDADIPLAPPIGRNGRPETARQSFGIDAVNEFDPLFEDIYEYCDAQGLDIDTLNHESGAAQIEINFRYGDALDLADQVFLFKRTVRQTAMSHDIYATFMARPMQHEPGSAMHIHQSVLDRDGNNIFAGDQDGNSPLFLSYIAGLQRYAPEMILLFAPNVNSYRRFSFEEAPINIHWGRDNRSCGFRVPLSEPEHRRVENRLAGADVNPYLAIAATLACGYLGMVEGLEPTPEETGGAYQKPRGIPQYFSEALSEFALSDRAREIFGDRFVHALIASKEVEFRNYHAVISSWEREHLLLNV